MLGYLCVFLGTICVGAVAVLTKLSLEYFTPITFTFFIYCFSLPLSIPLGKSLRGHLNKKVLLLTAGHMAGIYFGWIVFSIGVKNIDAASAAFVSRVEFFLILFLSWFILKEKLGKSYIPAFFLTVIGLYLLADQEALGKLSNWKSERNLGLGLIMLSTLGFSIGEFFSKKISTLINSRVFTFYRNLFMAVALLPTLLIEKEINLLPTKAYLLCFLCALTGPVLARILYMEGLKRLPLGHVTVFAQLEPLMALIISFTLGIDVPDKRSMMGGVLIILSCFFIVIPKFFKNKKPRPGAFSN